MNGFSFSRVQHAPCREVPIEERVVHLVYAHRHGDLLGVDGAANPRQRFVIDGRSGRLFMPVKRTVLLDGEATLCVPEERVGVELLCDLAAAEEVGDGEWIDRWSAYHGAPTGVMAALLPQAAKAEGVVVDADEIDFRNPLVGMESRLVRQLNADREALARACRATLGVDVFEALAVGVDAWGVDVRTRIGVLRVRMRDGAISEAEAEGAVEAFLRGD